MFDTSLFEILIIFVVTLLVIGPERLPALARTLGVWLGKIRQWIHLVKEDFDQQLKIDQLAENKKRAAEADEKMKVSSTKED